MTPIQVCQLRFLIGYTSTVAARLPLLLLTCSIFTESRQDSNLAQYTITYISFCITYKSTIKYEIQQSQINQNFGTVCHIEVYLTFSRIGTKLSGTIGKFRGSKSASKFNIDCHLTSMTLKGPTEFFLKKSWNNPLIVTVKNI